MNAKPPIAPRPPSQLILTRSARSWRGQTDAVKDRLAVFGIGIAVSPSIGPRVGTAGG